MADKRVYSNKPQRLSPLIGANTPFGEKIAETEENLLEHRTYATDAFDTHIGCEKFTSHESLSLSTSRVL